MRTIRYLELDGAILRYGVFGNGTNPLLAFHGAGEDLHRFNDLTSVLENKYLIYSFDLFFHGESYWPYKETPLKIDFWKKIIEKFLARHNINEFSMLGFSLGGKFVFTTLSLFNSRINEMILISPDGVSISPWYTIATHSVFSRIVFKSLIFSPDIFKRLVQVLKLFGLINTGIAKFAIHQLHDQKSRERIYMSWVVFRKLKFNIAEIGKLVNKNQIRVILFKGNYDKVIRSKDLDPLIKIINDLELIELDSGHNNIISSSAKFIETNPERVS